MIHPTAITYDLDIDQMNNLQKILENNKFIHIKIAKFVL